MDEWARNDWTQKTAVTDKSERGKWNTVGADSRGWRVCEEYGTTTGCKSGKEVRLSEDRKKRKGIVALGIVEIGGIFGIRIYEELYTMKSTV